MNKLIVSGRITRNEEIKLTDNQKAYYKNSIAIKNDRKNKNGEYETTFIDFIAWENNANYLGSYAKKGDFVELEGQLSIKTKDDKKYVEMIVEKSSIITSEKVDKREDFINPDEMKVEIEIDDDLPF